MATPFRNIVSIIFIILCVGMVSYPPHARSQEDIDKKHTLEGFASFYIGTVDTFTEDMAVEMALERSVELELLDNKVRVASYRFDSSGRIDNPELRLRELSSRYFNEHRDELQVGLRLRLPGLGESAMAKQEARVDIWRRKVDALRYRHRLAADVRRTCAGVIMYGRLAELDQRKMTLDSERITLVEGMMDLGRSSVVDLTRARLEYAESKSDYTRTIQRRNQARMTLAGLVGTSEEFTLAVEDLPEVEQNHDLLIEVALENRPEIELARQRKVLAEKERTYESRKVIPWPTFVELSYHALRDREDWDELRMGVNLPLFNWNRGNRNATGLAAKSGDLETDVVHREIEEEVKSAYSVYIGHLRNCKSYQQEIEPLMRDAAALIHEDEMYGALPPDDILDMELAIIEARKELVEKQCDLAYALADLYLVLGIKGPERLRGKGVE